MHRSLTAILLTSTFVSSPVAAADWSFFALIPESTCITECAAENAARAEQVERMRLAYDKVEAELDRILEWMDAQGFQTPFFPQQP